MLELIVPMSEGFNEETQEFVTVDAFKLEMEHSLVSLSKWESEFQKPFLHTKDKTAEEIYRYVKLMTLTPDVPDEVFLALTERNVREIDAYLDSKQTATWFTEDPNQKPSQEIITSEVIYYWMFSSGIDKSCEEWNLNRLFTLIKVFSEKNKPQKKMSKAKLAQQHRDLNAQRRAQLGTTG